MDTSQFNDMFQGYNVGNNYGSQPQIQPAAPTANPGYQTVPQGSIYNVNANVEGLNFNRKKRHFYI
jgi:hypothetical protein